MTFSQADLFSSETGGSQANTTTQNNHPANTSQRSRAPLAARMRPTSLEEFAGQQHLLAPGKLLRRAIDSGHICSLILYGPPGTGKTTLAEIIAHKTKARFVRLNAVDSSVAELRKVIAGANVAGSPTLLFVDELHRFNKAQQEVLLPEVESGELILVGATTLNPFFYVVPPLLSRSLIFELQPLEVEDLLALGKRAIRDAERGLGRMALNVHDAALKHLAIVSDGDARRFLNALELAALTTPPDVGGVIYINAAEAQESIQRKAVVYDADGDAHYDTTSAFIKSLRGSDPDAALYWLAKMLHAGEDPRFITRRMIIAASEDIGMADPRALLIAVAAQQALETVGLPEAALNLAQAAIYLATAPKSNSCTTALAAAMDEVKSKRTLPVPNHLRDTHYKGAERLGRGEGYKYSHDYERAIVSQAYLPEERRFYKPTDSGYEHQVRLRLEEWREEMQRQSHPPRA